MDETDPELVAAMKSIGVKQKSTSSNDDSFWSWASDDDKNANWDFSNAKDLVLWCNGMWCGQSPNNILSLLSFGYPAEKLKWYRGGMQNWANLGFTTTKVDAE
jgi:rhodanese-related sulfurtransferase